MAFNIPTTAASAAQILANIEAKINQNSPLLPKAFNRVLSVALGLVITGLYKYASERAKQNLVLTATGVDLERLGADRGVIRKKASAAVVTATLPANDGVVIPLTVTFTANSNGFRYFNNAAAAAAASVATLTLTSETLGAAGNLEVSNTLSIGAQIAGATTLATVTAIVKVAADLEDQEVYRARVLTAYRSKTGGANSADYRIWSEEVEGVKRAYPYAGGPIDQVTPTPPERTVYIESTVGIDPDGVPTQALLDTVRANIIIDPVTGFERQPLGLTNDTLFVEPISRLPIHVTVQNLSVDVAKEAQAKADIAAALDLYFSQVFMFVAGLDFVDDKNDVLTIASIGGVVDDALQATGGTITSVAFGRDATVSDLRYTLLPGQLVNSGPLLYA